MKHLRKCVWKRTAQVRRILEKLTNQLTQSKDYSLKNDIITFSLLKASEKLTQRLNKNGQKKLSYIIPTKFRLFQGVGPRII